MTITIRSHRGPYTVSFGPLFHGLEDGLSDAEHLLIDDQVAMLYSTPLAKALSSRSVLRISATEENKSLERVPAYIEALMRSGCKRNHKLVAVGGGIIQDITAFIAAVLFRGMPWRFYPTTLLAQADSCIGSKSSINVAGYKNQVGTFTPPESILISTEVLGTLDAAARRSGLGEVLKIHFISGAGDFNALAKNFDRLLENSDLLQKSIHRSLEIKKQLIEKDEFDQNERLILNYGHTFGHAIETATHHAIPHGIAVTLGMDMANFVSHRWGFIEEPQWQALHGLMRANSMAFDHVEIHRDKFFQALTRDKKNVDQDLVLILTKGPGAVFRGRYPFNEGFKNLCNEFLDARARQPH